MKKNRHHSFLSIACIAGIIAGIMAGGAQAVNLGGVEVPKEKFIVFIFHGHSNMIGWNTSQNDPTPNPSHRGWEYRWWDTKEALRKKWLLLMMQPISWEVSNAARWEYSRLRI